MTGQNTHDARPLTVLFVDGDNAGCSQIAEAVLRHRAGGHIRALSAGLSPSAALAPEVSSVLAAARTPSGGLAPKSWGSFQGAFQPRIDLVIILGTDAAIDGSEISAGFPGRPKAVRWPVEDPATAGGKLSRRRAYGAARRRLERLCDAFSTLLQDAAKAGSLADAALHAATLAPEEQRPVGQRRVSA